MMGPGKYDDVCTVVRETTRARGVLVAVIDGDLGNGFSCQATPEITLKLPQYLRQKADNIEAARASGFEV